MPFPLIAFAVGTLFATGVACVLSDSRESSSRGDDVSADDARRNYEKAQKQEGFNSAIKQLWNDYLMDQYTTLDEQGFNLFMQSSKTGLDRLKEAFSLDELETGLRNELRNRLDEIEREQADLFEMHKKYSSEGAK